MKKTIIKAVVLAAVLVAMPVSIFAASSTNRGSSSSGGGGGGGGGGGSSSSSSGTVVSSSSSSGPTGSTITVGSGETTATVTTSGSSAVVDSTDGTKTNITFVTVNTTTDSSGTASTIVYGLLYDATATTGEAITRDSQGNAVTGDTAVSIQQEEKEMAGLSESTINTINAINSGSLSAVAGVNLNGYYLVGKTIPLFTWDASTLTEKVGNAETTVYISELPQAGNVAMVLFYNNHTGQWQQITPTRVDIARGLVSLVIPGAGTVAVFAK